MGTWLWIEATSWSCLVSARLPWGSMSKTLGLNSQLEKKAKYVHLCRALSPIQLISAAIPLGHFLKPSQRTFYLSQTGRNLMKHKSFSDSGSPRTILSFSQKPDKVTVVLPGRRSRLWNFPEVSFDLLVSASPDFVSWAPVSPKLQSVRRHWAGSPHWGCAW